MMCIPASSSLGQSVYILHIPPSFRLLRPTVSSLPANIPNLFFVSIARSSLEAPSEGFPSTGSPSIPRTASTSAVTLPLRIPSDRSTLLLSILLLTTSSITPAGRLLPGVRPHGRASPPPQGRAPASCRHRPFSEQTSY